MRVSVWESGEESAAQPMAGDSQLMIALQPHEGSRGCQSRSKVKRRPNQRAPTTFIVVAAADACVVSHISPSAFASLKFFFLGDFVWFMSWPNNNNNHNTPSCVQLSPCNLNELPALPSLFPLSHHCLFATLKRLSPHCKAATAAAAADQAQINTL